MKLKQLLKTNLNEILDIEQSLKYARSFRLEKIVKEEIKNSTNVFAYEFNYNNILIGVYHFKRNGNYEVHFYDATNGETSPSGLSNTNPGLVFTTVFTIFYNYWIKSGRTIPILIAYNDDQLFRLYSKYILIVFKKYSIGQYYDLSTRDKVITESGFQAIRISPKIIKETVNTILDNYNKG